MFFGTGSRSSMTHTAACPASGRSCEPNALVVLVKTKLFTPAATAASSRLSVPVTLVSTKSCLLWVATCGLCSVAVWITAGAPPHLAPPHHGAADDARRRREGGGG